MTQMFTTFCPEHLQSTPVCDTSQEHMNNTGHDQVKHEDVATPYLWLLAGHAVMWSDVVSAATNSVRRPFSSH